MAEWTSTYDVHEIDALPAGTYVLTEVTAPDGYEVAESVTFEVINSRKIQTVVMKDSPYVLLKGGTGNIETFQKIFFLQSSLKVAYLY